MKTQIKYLDHPALAEVRTLFALAWPVVGNNLVVSLMSFTDVVMAGRLSGADLAAVAVGSNVWLLFFFAARGVLAALSPIISQHHGARRIDLIGSYVRHGVALALVLSLAVLTTLHFGAGPLLEAVGIDPPLRIMATDFVKAIAWGAPALCVFLVFRFALEGMGSTRPIFFLSIIGLLFNVATNFVFVYGYLGAPAMGGVGCGVASALSMWLILLITVAYVLRSRWLDVLRNVVPGRATSRIPWEILRLGAPIAGAVVAENGFFVAATLVMGRISVNAAAAHQIAMNYASMMFMIPMALASALAVRVGGAVGEGNLVEARKRGTVGILACAVVMTISAMVLLTLRRQITGLYTVDPEISSIAASLLLIAVVFQISDGLQVGCSGALRGFKDTLVPFVIAVTAYWVIGFPLTWYASQQIPADPEQVWWGFVIALTIAAVLMIARFTVFTQRLIRTGHAPMSAFPTVSH
ncbi:MATE family efflux transporter [Burkholderia sp. L27(2015)]|uniref:MATE family efflux transporter n=1 Tax=Burkholderia sp. L27(2015) TaxID=1641858 RepID=UPI00131D3124|nr:MATE family efflux transporter [Burkholderia sp. L27(2015)]